MSLRDLLEKYRAGSSSEREKGTYFERLTKIWLENAPTQRSQFSRVLMFSDWAKENRFDQRDTGIDLVARLSDSPDDWCAIQCKFYRKGYRIQKGDIDSFFTTSGKRPFTRRLIVDTTGVQWSEHAEEALRDQIVETTRVGISDLDESGIDWQAFAATDTVRLIERKKPRQHQIEALDAVRAELAVADRGKIIMACGTGKTYTALHIAEQLVGKGGRVLFLVPSLSLMSQTIREWSIDANIPLRSFAVCSDSQVGVRRAADGDIADIDVHDLEIPATTHGATIAAKATPAAPDSMTVVFSTYQSIQSVSAAQLIYGLPEFDLIICDEAHRTTGVKLAEEEESNFIRIHDATYVKGKKRIYMTATPRIFGETVKKTADEADAVLCSMDDTRLFGETLFTRNFSWAVQNGLLTDYKVIVLAVDEGAVSAGVQRLLADENSELKLDDATKIVGCYKALTKADLRTDVAGDTGPMRRALAFAKDIKRSKLVEAAFARVAKEWRDTLDDEVAATIPPLDIEIKHVDGTFSAHARNERLSWLKDTRAEAETCRILTNARCLSEGVDVPALDAILFLHPRKSQIDVVQSVGRVMRRAEGKKMGYVILPVAVPAGKAPEEALDDNEKYRVVWQILNALRAHDDRLDATINKIDLGVDPGDRIEIIAVTNEMPTRAEPKKTGIDVGAGGGAGDTEPGDDLPQPPRGGGDNTQTSFQFDEFAKAIMARIVKKCGSRTYWEDWAKDVARIAEVHVTRIRAAVQAKGSEERNAFEAFLAEIRDDLNDSITEEEAIEMLAQHLITRPVFDALFESYSFAANNPVSKALQGVLDVLDRQHLEKEAEALDKFYASVRMRAQGITDATAKQKIVVELYDKFFKAAFPKLTARLGIVYTPVEVVDFIIHSVDEVLQTEFGQTLGSEGVHIIDPFVGTGTFITRLLQSGLIKPEQMAHKYRNEIHANEIVLLAYYIAAINIEAVYHEIVGGEFEPFPGICLTDTFQLYEQERDLLSGTLEVNSNRRTRQKKLDIRVIIGNPPYSAGQKSENDNAANLDYPRLDGRIEATYAAQSSAKLKNALYDSYIRAIRWATDRIGDRGVIGFVTNAGWLDSNTADGLRKCLVEEFSSLHIFHLRGNQRTSGDRSRREGGKIFGQGSRTPVAIAILVKNPASTEQGVIRFHDIGEYLTREQKLAITARFGGLKGIAETNGWVTLTPDEHGDWLNQRDRSFDAFLAIGDKRGSEIMTLFEAFSSGVKTHRDAWAFNFSRQALETNMERMIAFYNEELTRFEAVYLDSKRAEREIQLDKFLDADAVRISWSGDLKQEVARGTLGTFEASAVVVSSYRPFASSWLYFDRLFNNRVYRLPRLFPTAIHENTVITINLNWVGTGMLALMSRHIPDLHFNGDAQCFPRYLYDVADELVEDALQGELLQRHPAGQATRRDAITDEGLRYVTDAYPNEAVTKDDVFYYVYGLLHSEEYRKRYADNLTKQLPRIPLMNRYEDFRAFVTAGRELGELHVNFEGVEPFPVTIKEGDLRLANIPNPVAYYRVEKMKFGGKRPNQDKTTVIYNPKITITGVPLEAYDYVVNGKPALEWVMERQCVKTDPASGIINDANRYAIETVGDPAYPFKLFCRIIKVSLETMRIVNSLPGLDIREADTLSKTQIDAAASVFEMQGP